MACLNSQSRNAAVFITREVSKARSRFFNVTHDADDHGWQFIGLSAGSAENERTISLLEAVRMDSSGLELSKLPVGWHAWRHGERESWIQAPLDDSTSFI
jgi:hypothetical protein